MVTNPGTRCITKSAFLAILWLLLKALKREIHWDDYSVKLKAIRLEQERI